MYLVSVNSFQKLARLILKINPNQAFCRENVTVTSEKCMVDPWIIRYPCMEVKNLLFFLCVYSFWQLTLRCIQNCSDCCYRWLGSGKTPCSIKYQFWIIKKNFPIYSLGNSQLVLVPITPQPKIGDFFRLIFQSKSLSHFGKISDEN